MTRGRDRLHKSGFERVRLHGFVKKSKPGDMKPQSAIENHHAIFSKFARALLVFQQPVQPRRGSRITLGVAIAMKKKRQLHAFSPHHPADIT
jgi:hypothetical protein